MGFQDLPDELQRNILYGYNINPVAEIFKQGIQETLNEIDRLQELLDLELAVLEQQSNTDTSLQPTTVNDNLQEIADYIWNNLTDSKNSKGKWIYTVYELKNDLNLSELNSRFVKLKEEKRQIAQVKQKFLKDFTNKREINDYSKRGELPSQRAFLEDNTEIVKQYVINCK
jgi:hypothetical protein